MVQSGRRIQRLGLGLAQDLSALDNFQFEAALLEPNIVHLVVDTVGCGIVAVGESQCEKGAPHSWFS